MKLAHCSDLHITRGPRLDDQRATLSAMVDSMIERRADIALVVGDAYGREVPHLSHPDERNTLLDAVTRLGEHMPVVYVCGNHDDARDLAALRFAQTAWSVHVVDTPTTLTIPTPAGLVVVHGLPYPTRRSLLTDGVARTLDESQVAAVEALEGILAGWSGDIRRARKTGDRTPHVLAAHVAVGGATLAGGEVLAGHEIEVSRAALDGLPIDYGALGHLHLRQEAAKRCWYSGSPWRNDHSELDPKGWHLVTIGDGGRLEADAGYPNENVYGRGDYQLRTSSSVWRMPNHCRTFATIDYRYATDREDGEPRWITRPTEEAIAACRGAEVRMRLVVPETMVGGCPWDVEVTRVQGLAHRVVVERVIEPVLRVRAPGVATAYTPRQKLETYWTTLATKPTPAEREAALLCLDEVTHG